MRKRILVSAVICLGALALQAQEANQIEKFNQQLRQLQESFDKQQREMKDNFERLLREQQVQIDALKKQLGTTNDAKPALTPEQKKLADELAAELGGAKGTTNSPGTALPVPTKAWSPSQPITVARAGSAYMNVSFDALIDFGWSTAKKPDEQLQLGDHDPIQRGFSLRNAEIAMDGAVDPYFKGFANIVFKLDKNGETATEMEEVFAQTTSLPGNLQLKGGQFFTAFGRQNPQHPHAWAFVDQPLILNRAFGPEGLRNIGAQLSWLTPLPFFTEATLGVFNGQSSQAFSFRNPGEDDGFGTNRFAGRATKDRPLRGGGDLLFVPRLASSFDLSDEQTLVVGASGAFGPNDTGPHQRTEIYGVDAYWKWKPANASEGFPFLSWQTEALYRRFEAGADPTASLPAEVIRDYGFYSQILWGFRPHWVAGLRGEWVTGNNTAIDSTDIYRGDRTRLSPVLTWYPSEFSKIRLQYNYDMGQHFSDQHSVWLQFEFTLGAHAAHKY